MSSLKYWFTAAARAAGSVTLVTLLAINFAVAQNSDQDVPASSDNFYVVAFHAVDVPAKEAGVLVDVPVEEGDHVDEEQQLAQVDDAEILMAVDIALAKYRSAREQATNDVNIRAAEKQRDVYKAEYDVALETNSKVAKTVSKTEIRRLKYQEVRSELGIEQAEFERKIAAYDAAAAHKEYARAEAMAKKMKIRSPVIGIISKIYRRKGNWVAPGDPVMRVVRMDRLRVTGALSSEAYAQSRVIGRDVLVRVDLPGGGSETLNAKIGFASPEIKDDLMFEVWAEIENRRNADGSWIFTPGLSASLSFN